MFPRIGMKAASFQLEPQTIWLGKNAEERIMESIGFQLELDDPVNLAEVWLRDHPATAPWDWDELDAPAGRGLAEDVRAA